MKHAITLITLLLASPAALHAVGAGQRLSSAGKPNVIFILTDDQGWGDLGCYGHPYAKTPNLDRLAKEGTRFTQFYVNSTVCAPSRVALMTGQYPARHNVHYIYAEPEKMREWGVPPYLDPAIPTVADLMRDRGYRTGHIGKWHLSGNAPGNPDPAELGFDFHKVAGGREADADYRARWQRSEHPVTASSHWIMEDAVRFIEQYRGSGKPFYLNLWTHAPHAKLLPSPEEMAVYKDLEPKPEDFESWMKGYAGAAKNLQSQMRIFCATLTSLDAAIGKLLAYLEETGLARNTLIVFTSDNGPEDYHVSAASNAGMGSPGLGRGRKRSIYEGGVRVPCIVRWPGRVPAGRVSDAVWTGVDLMPTLAAIIGSQPPNAGSMDGEDVSDIWLGAERQRRREIYWEWKFEVRGNPDYLPPQLAVRDGDWKLLCRPDGTRVELYRIPADLAEKNNLAASFPDRAETMKRKLLDWKKTLPERYVYQDEK